jgi:hypothetical protein
MTDVTTVVPPKPKPEPQPGAPPAKVSYFHAVELDNAEAPTRIILTREPNSPPPPAALRAFLGDLHKVEHIVRTVYSQQADIRRQFFNDLHVTADTGLRGPDYSLEQGMDNLKSVQDEIAEAFPAVRDYYWYRYGIYALFSVVLLLAGAALYYFVGDTGNISLRDAKGQWTVAGIAVLAALWIPFGVALGIFLEYVFSIKDQITFDELSKINPARWHPFQRLINTVVTSYVFAAAMALSIFQVGVAAVLLNEFATTKPYLSIVVGFVTGFGSPFVQDLIGQIRPAVRNAPAGS